MKTTLHTFKCIECESPLAQLLSDEKGETSLSIMQATTMLRGDSGFPDRMQCPHCGGFTEMDFDLLKKFLHTETHLFWARVCVKIHDFANSLPDFPATDYLQSEEARILAAEAEELWNGLLERIKNQGAKTE